MGIKLSTGLRNHLLDTGSFKSAFATAVAGDHDAAGEGSKILIFGGTVPASADDATTGATLLCTIHNQTGSQSGNYDLCFEAAASGTLAKETNDTWDGEIVATGTATFFRMVSQADAGTASSTTLPRIQGAISADGTAPGVLSITSLVDNDSNRQAIEYFYISVPAG